MKITKTKSYKTVLYSCFESDNDLLNMYHISAPADLFTCVNKTYNDMQEFKNFEFYRLSDKMSLFGYFGKEQVNGNQFLTGFFITEEHRNKDGYKKFWDAVNGKFTKPFYICVYDKNTRASKFLEKSGAKLYKTVDANGHPGKVFEMSKE